MRRDGSPALRMTEKRYHKQKARGTEGFGFVAIQDKKVVDYWRCEEEKQLLDRLRDQTAGEILLHHRNPTSTPNFWECAHPLLISDDKLTHDYMVIHNGVIHNTDKMKASHARMGIAYRTEIVQQWATQGTSKDWPAREIARKFNDSESLAIELALNLDADGHGIGDVEGSIAFVAIQFHKESGAVLNKFWGRNYGSPLRFTDDNTYLSISSEEGRKDVKVHTLYSYSYETGKISDKPYTVGLTTYVAERPATNGWERRDWYRTRTIEADGKDSHVQSAIDYLEHPLDRVFEERRVSVVLPEPSDTVKKDLVDSYPDISRIHKDMDKGVALDVFLDLESEKKSIEDSLSKTTAHTDSYSLYLIERLAAVEDELKKVNEILNVIDLSKMGTR